MATFTVLGAGMMGSALCVPLADRGHDVRLVGTHLDRHLIAGLRGDGIHPTLKHPLPGAIKPYFIEELAVAMDGCEVLALGVSSAGIPWACQTIGPHARADLPLFMITKGLHWDGSRLHALPEIVRQSLPPSLREIVHPAAVAGPCIAGELARRVPSCVVLAGHDPRMLEHIAALVRTDFYHAWVSTDLIGVEVCAALKNAYAMAVAFGAGIHEAAGGQPGSIALHNYESAIFAQAIYEMQRIVAILGGQPETVAGLAGVGDLDVTNNGGRTGRFGRWLGTGIGVQAAVAKMEGATLECLEIIAVMRKATRHWQASGQVPAGALPLLDHMAAVVLDGARVDVPLGRFFGDDVADLVVGIDCSTTACKAVAWNREGSPLAVGRAQIALQSPEPDAWEQDAETWWDALGSACRELMRAVDPARVAAVCVTNQRETFVVTDADGTPLHNALVWMDHRCGRQVERARASLGPERLHELSGKPSCTTPSLYKLMFLLDAQPGLRRRDARVLDVHAFCVWRLTGRFATSLAAADPTGMIDMASQTWSPELLGLVGLEEDQVPELFPPGARIGMLSSTAAAHTGFLQGTPVVAGAGDGQCAGLGAGIMAPGRAYLNLGTAIVSGVLSTSYRCDRAFRTLYGAAPGTYFLETDLQGGTFTVTWLLETLIAGQKVPLAPGAPDTLATLEERAVGIGPGAGGLVLVPYWNGVMNPFWDDEASGVVLGWRGGHDRAHLYRAILEGIALEQRLHTSGVEAATSPIHELVVMGGGSQSDLWCQILADVLNNRIVRAGSAEATALGAGILAAVDAGLHPDLGAACTAMTSTGQVFEPGPAQPFYDRLYREVYAGLYEVLRERMQRLWRLRTENAS